MAWNVTLDPYSPKWSILVKQTCAVVTFVALTAFLPLRTGCCFGTLFESVVWCGSVLIVGPVWVGGVSSYRP